MFVVGADGKECPLELSEGGPISEVPGGVDGASGVDCGATSVLLRSTANAGIGVPLFHPVVSFS